MNAGTASFKARINAIADHFDSADSVAVPYAVLNLRNRQPAFWTSAKYHNAVATSLNGAANRLASVTGAIAELGRRFGDIAVLDKVLPLNDAAVRDLQAAYEDAGTFRSMSELTRRIEAVEGKRVAA